jgi:hypothetical protein
MASKYLVRPGNGSFEAPTNASVPPEELEIDFEDLHFDDERDVPLSLVEIFSVKFKQLAYFLGEI